MAGDDSRASSRSHSALDYRSPMEFEADLKDGTLGFTKKSAHGIGRLGWRSWLINDRGQKYFVGFPQRKKKKQKRKKYSEGEAY